jgi:hypothetical protein
MDTMPVGTTPKRTAAQTLDATFLEMRWRCLSLAADLDRVQRGSGGDTLIASDARLLQLRQAIGELLSDKPGRAERVQTIFSDVTPPPVKL